MPKKTSRKTYAVKPKSKKDPKDDDINIDDLKENDDDLEAKIDHLVRKKLRSLADKEILNEFEDLGNASVVQLKAICVYFGYDILLDLCKITDDHKVLMWALMKSKHDPWEYAIPAVDMIAYNVKYKNMKNGKKRSMDIISNTNGTRHPQQPKKRVRINEKRKNENFSSNTANINTSNQVIFYFFAFIFGFLYPFYI